MTHLVLPGTHGEFAQYLRKVYGPGGGAGRPPARPLMKREDFFGLAVEDVERFVWVGTYWNNPVWGSEEYHWFMAAALEFAMPWAITWVDDYAQAQQRRHPLDPAEIVAARRGLERLEKELSDG